jgi:hypothetical protein
MLKGFSLFLKEACQVFFVSHVSLLTYTSKFVSPHSRTRLAPAAVSIHHMHVASPLFALGINMSLARVFDALMQYDEAICWTLIAWCSSHCLQVYTIQNPKLPLA